MASEDGPLWRAETRILVGFRARGMFRGRVPDKLVEIMEWKRKEVAARTRAVSEQELSRLDASTPRPPSFAEALRRKDGALAVIAEIKRRSPSAGDIAKDA